LLMSIMFSNNLQLKCFFLFPSFIPGVLGCIPVSVQCPSPFWPRRFQPTLSLGLDILYYCCCYYFTESRLLRRFHPYSILVVVVADIQEILRPVDCWCRCTA